MKLAKLISYLETIAPPHLQEDYDNAGLITGQKDMDINGLLICLDAIESVIEEAISLGYNLIVAHHPIVFRGLKRINGNNYIERTIIKAIKNNIAIYAIHTNLDNVYNNGVSTKIAELIGLEDIRILCPKPETMHGGQQVGSGAIGKLSSPKKTEDFLAHLSDTMNLKGLKHTSLCKEQISTVAVCGGSGSFLLKNAIGQEADIYISADFKYHEFFDADDRIIVADIGHFESEKFTIDLLYEVITSEFDDLDIKMTSITTNPVQYYVHNSGH
jgi:dinuclear metal center YbgI/SA1388 family protein